MHMVLVVCCLFSEPTNEPTRRTIQGFSTTILLNARTNRRFVRWFVRFLSKLLKQAVCSFVGSFVFCPSYWNKPYVSSLSAVREDEGPGTPISTCIAEHNSCVLDDGTMPPVRDLTGDLRRVAIRDTSRKRRATFGVACNHRDKIRLVEEKDVSTRRTGAMRRESDTTQLTLDITTTAQ